jgi:hypothetical protein
VKAQRFAVATTLSMGSFDDRREGRALIAKVMTELRRLRRADPRVVTGRLRAAPGARDAMEVVLTIEADTAWEAYEIGAAAVRSSIHAAGGATAGWERTCPRVLQIAPSAPVTRRRRGGQRNRPRPADAVRTASTWDGWAAIAARTAHTHQPLPPFAMPSNALIDLR